MQIIPWMECSIKGMNLAQAGPVCGLKDGVNELARSTPALEAHLLGDVAFAVVEVARPDAAVFVGVGSGRALYLEKNQIWFKMWSSGQSSKPPFTLSLGSTRRRNLYVIGCCACPSQNESKSAVTSRPFNLDGR